MDLREAAYVIRYFGQFMTEKEHLAHRHLQATAKATKGRTDAAAQAEVRDGAHHLRELLSNDPEVLRLTADGWEQFAQRAAARLLAEHKGKIVLNYCSRCGQLARTPKARQCWTCGLDWHEKGL